MPHITITMYPGRDAATKMALAKKMQQAMVEELHVDPSIISVSIEDLPPEEWDAWIAKFSKETMFI